MVRPFALLPPTSTPTPGWRARAERFLLRSFAGRVLLVALAVKLLSTVLPLSDFLTVPATGVLWLIGLWGAYRLLRALTRTLLWRIRSKLIVSYLFIALVPVLLLTLLFFLSGVLGVALLAAHLVNEELAGLGRTLLTTSEVALADLPAGDEAATTAFKARLGPARITHPSLAATLLRRGRVVVSWGGAPQALPSWWKEKEFAGLTGAGEGKDVFRAVCVRGDATAILDLPLDRALFAPLAERLGIHVLREDGRPVDVGEAPADGRGFNGAALPERLDWDTGQIQTRPLAFRFQALDLLRHISPGIVGDEDAKRQNLSEILVIALWVVGNVFLVMYGVALLLGLLLARSITRSVHELSRGTERLRLGDFKTPIPVTSRDQLGELADSFNHMARGIEGLLLQQVEKDRLEEELRIARQIQMSLLPAEKGLALPGLRIAALCLPAAEVGGDYYDLLPLSPTRLGVLIADVSGKGTSAALYMAELKGLVLSLSRIYESPGQLLSEANRILAANMDARSFITMTYAVVDVEKRTMRYARAGHNPLIHLQAETGKTRILTPPGLGLGMDKGDRFDAILEEDEVALRVGDVFLFFTDGLSEAMNPEAELFGEGRLQHILAESEALTTEEIREKILGEVRAFAEGMAQADDMTMVILKVAA
jgi:serine phosphatase RsbU (regulator of sigma subunit)